MVSSIQAPPYSTSLSRLSGIQHTTQMQYYAMSSLEPSQDRLTLFKCIRFYSHITLSGTPNLESIALLSIEVDIIIVWQRFLYWKNGLVVITSVGNKAKLCRNTKH